MTHIFRSWKLQGQLQHVQYRGEGYRRRILYHRNAWKGLRPAWVAEKNQLLLSSAQIKWGSPIYFWKCINICSISFIKNKPYSRCFFYVRKSQSGLWSSFWVLPARSRSPLGPIEQIFNTSNNFASSNCDIWDTKNYCDIIATRREQNCESCMSESVPFFLYHNILKASNSSRWVLRRLLYKLELDSLTCTGAESIG